MMSDVFDLLFLVVLFAVLIPLGLPGAIEMYQRQTHLVEELAEDKNSQSFEGYGTAEQVEYDDTFSVFDVALLTQLQDSNNPPNPNLVYVTSPLASGPYSFRVDNDYTDKLQEISVFSWQVLISGYSINPLDSVDTASTIPRFEVQHGFSDSGNFWKIAQVESGSEDGVLAGDKARP